MKRVPLIVKLLIAIALGFFLGIAIRQMADQGMLWAMIPGRILVTFNGIFGNFLGFVVPLLIVAFVSVGIAELGRGAGKMLGFAVLLAYTSTVLAGLFAYGVGSTVIPRLLDNGFMSLEITRQEGGLALERLFSIDMPALFPITSALIAAFILGIGVSTLGERGALYEVLNSFQKIVEKIIGSIIIPLLPFHIAGIFMSMAFDGEALQVLGVMALIFVLIIAMHWIMLIVHYTLAGTMRGKNPFVMLKTMLPAYFAAIGTQSSVATMPVTRQCTIKNGADENIVNFTVPLFTTIHMPGSIITITTSALAVSLLMGHSIETATMISFIFSASIMMVAAPGVPGGSIMAASGVLQSILGFDATLLSLMIAIYLAQDSFGTAANVTGDGALTFFVEKFAKKEGITGQ